MNPYVELEVSRTATSEEIKARYRILANLHHPDRGGDEEVFKQIKLAYEILIDPIRRKEYDLTGNASLETNIRNDALDYIAQMVNRIVPAFDANKDNLIDLMVKEVTTIKQDCDTNILTCKRFQSNLQIVMQKTRIKTDGENLLLKLLQTQLDQRNQELINFHRRINTCNLIIEILNDYKYGLDELGWIVPPPPGAPTEN